MIVVHRKKFCEKVMRQRITRRQAVKTKLLAPCLKMLHAHFSALIPLTEGTHCHYRSLHTYGKEKKCRNKISIHQSTNAHSHLSLPQQCCFVETNWTERATIRIYCISRKRVKLRLAEQVKNNPMDSYCWTT